ncbi:hypothetical protein F3Y22_tig00112490pilonHSYRG00034 [Hibiscus syriacus]|uniref:Uncharacterized protein n=1 Tax=Hibiscus syriacus TaxID=106335 RepID=A0A6A2WYG7_HIBSY|nr:hypothetical protein F3Y22_tig00112490pilonHSYRG00034 [Hibiscus syriacus]
MTVNAKIPTARSSLISPSLFASTVQMDPDGKDAWIFDIDETLLTNLPYYMDHEFGGRTAARILSSLAIPGGKGLSERSFRCRDTTTVTNQRRSVLVNGGCRIHGSTGDQWSDFLGFEVAKRSFKLPNLIQVSKQCSANQRLCRGNSETTQSSSGDHRALRLCLCMSLPDTVSGKLPISELRLTSKTCISENSPTPSGMQPVNWLLSSKSPSILREITFNWLLLRKIASSLLLNRSSGMSPEKLLNLRDCAMEPVAVKVEDRNILEPLHLETGTEHTFISTHIRTNPSLQNPQWVICDGRFPCLKSSVSSASFDTKGLMVGLLLLVVIPPPIQTPPPPTAAGIADIMPTPPPKVTASCVGIICQRIKAKIQNFPIFFSSYDEDSETPNVKLSCNVVLQIRLTCNGPFSV